MCNLGIGEVEMKAERRQRRRWGTGDETVGKEDGRGMTEVSYMQE